jgi:hypothetical protein
MVITVFWTQAVENFRSLRGIERINANGIAPFTSPDIDIISY